VSLAFVIPILFDRRGLSGRDRAGRRVAHRAVDDGRPRSRPAAPRYFLPTVAGGFIGSAAAAHAGFRSAGVAAFGIGLVCWLMLGSFLLNRLFLRGSLPAST
jgi:hypothetical protein